MTTEVRVLLNRQTDDEGRLAIFSRFGSGSAYREGDELEHVATLEVEGGTANEILNRAFAMTNHGSGSEAEGYRERSVSAGDVFEVAGVRWSVEGVGFQQLGDWWAR
jgi:hypothetical protein